MPARSFFFVDPPEPRPGGFEEFPQRLRARRIQNRLSQRDLADRVGVTHFAVSNWEAGRRTPRVGEVMLLAEALHVSLDWLLLGSDHAD